MKKLYSIIILLFLLLSFACQPAPADLRVHFIDVGQGDAVLIQSPGGKTVLIDGGERQPGVYRYLKQKKVREIDVLVATHPHSDHIGGLIEVLEKIPVKQVWVDGQLHTTKTYEEFLDAIDKSGAGFHEARRGEYITSGDLTFEILNPAVPFLEDLNNNSVVLRLVYGDLAFLFTGDAETDAEQSILSYTNNLKSTVLKVGHHASRTSSGEAFLRAVQPQMAVYSAGKGNPYGHPHPETIARFNKMNIPLYGTDINGTIIISTNGRSYNITTEK